MDETDSGLDIDALRIVSEGVNTIRDADGSMGVLLITHYKRILNYLHPDYVHVMLKGQIAHSGGPELADRLEEMGYDWLHEPETAAV
jgi:Fe-S cluster assembly ATP-binding protein